jgi:predicted O-linked N-acetylglucosamine transferase (SPINDLY family)
MLLRLEAPLTPSQVWLQIIDSVPNSTLWLLRFPEQAADNVIALCNQA